MTTRRYHLLNAILLLALFAGSAWAYPRLPARIPIHFDFAGRPDAWESRSIVSWFLLPAIAVGLAAFLRGASALAVRNPETWNLPDKRAFLALDPVARAPIVARMQEFMAFVGVMVTAVMCIVQASVYRAATGTETGLPPWAMAGIGLATLVMLAAGLRLNGIVGRMIREAHARAPAG